MRKGEGKRGAGLPRPTGTFRITQVTHPPTLSFSSRQILTS